MTLSSKLMEIIAEEKRAEDWAKAENADTRPMFSPGQIIQLPDTNPKTAFGMQKASFHCIPPIALIYLGAVCQSGADKYGVMNWREHAVTFSVYYNAMLRHLFAILDGEWLDPESGQPHLAHVMAGAAIVLDAKENGKLNDDRPLPGAAPSKMKRTA